MLNQGSLKTELPISCTNELTIKADWHHPPPPTPPLPPSFSSASTLPRQSLCHVTQLPLWQQDYHLGQRYQPDDVWCGTMDSSWMSSHLTLISCLSFFLSLSPLSSSAHFIRVSRPRPSVATAARRWPEKKSTNVGEWTVHSPVSKEARVFGGGVDSVNDYISGLPGHNQGKILSWSILNGLCMNSLWKHKNWLFFP